LQYSLKLKEERKTFYEMKRGEHEQAAGLAA
jgi:hypothetical protein